GCGGGGGGGNRKNISEIEIWQADRHTSTLVASISPEDRIAQMPVDVTHRIDMHLFESAIVHACAPPATAFRALLTTKTGVVSRLVSIPRRDREKEWQPQSKSV